jgi:prevent-host-death family protein
MTTEYVTLREINQHLARYIAGVEAGREFIITRRGQPVARLSPASAVRHLSEEQQAALERTRERMRIGFDLGGERVSREDIYDRYDR